ncbi:Uncharacterised protein [Mycobacteroides abscessus subsp. abscessus]|nr:Uncharacterised protein [Mycobacteroides abscessus subsp. abscessus]
MVSSGFAGGRIEVTVPDGCAAVATDTCCDSGNCWGPTESTLSSCR